MTSRDPAASYYDLTLPDGTRTEVWSVLRAVLTEEEALGYVKACILTRIMRDRKKPGVDRLREVEKVGIETGMLREAMAAYMATPDPMVAALDAVDSHDPRECAARIEDLERERDEARARIAELERELQRERDEVSAQKLRGEAAEFDLTRVRNESSAQRERAEKAERERDQIGAAFDAALNGGDDAGEELERVRAELAALRDRYRPRRLIEEKPTPDQRVLRWQTGEKQWVSEAGFEVIDPNAIWTNRPPAPEAEREGE